MSQSKLDANQVIKSSYDATSEALKTLNLGSLVPSAYDYLSISYVPSGPGAGEIYQVIYKTGGSGGTTVATLTLGYDAGNNLTSVTRT